MNITLNISERVNALKVLNAFKGNLDKLAIILEDIKGFPVTDEEWQKAERVITPQADGQEFWRWNDEKGGEKSIEISLITAEYLKTTINEMDAKGEFTVSDKPYISLLKKLS